MRLKPTQDEETVRALLNALKIKFSRQQIFTDKGLSSYIADFWLWEHRLIIECDGPSHDSDRAKVYDAERDRRFKEAGILTLRIQSAKIRTLTAKELMNRIP